MVHRNKRNLIGKTLIVFFLAITIVTGNNLQAFSLENGKITNHLQEQMEQLPANSLIQINITLNERFDSQSLLATANTMSKAERREYVIKVLKDFTALSQKGILADLKQFQRTAEVKDITAFWIANVINCKATPAAIKQLAKNEKIGSIDYDEKRILLEPGEKKNPYFIEGLSGDREMAWHITKINADDVWELGITGEGVVVSIIDTGVSYDHLDLKDHLWQSDEYPNHGYDFANNDNNPIDDFGHGTWCAGVAAGDGTAGSQTGIAPDAVIMCCKVLDVAGAGTESNVIEGVEFSVENGADILNLSFGWPEYMNPNRTLWRQTFDATAAVGIIVTVAAGNEGGEPSPAPDNITTPANLPPPWLHPDQTLIGGTSGVICVGATNDLDQIAAFSSYGPVDWSEISPYFDYPYDPEMGLIRPDVVAPGQNIKSISAGGNSDYVNGIDGTSFSCPANAGMIALMLQVHPTLTPAQVSQVIEETAVVLSPGKNNHSGSGRIDALAAVEGAAVLAGPSYYAHTFNDAGGNNNGEIDPADSILLTLVIANKREEISNDVTVVISTKSEHIIITDSTEYYGNFGSGETIEITDAYAFDVANNIPGGESIKFNIRAYNSEEEWESSFSVIANGVKLLLGNITINDPTGNNNGKLDPGEDATISIETVNSGQIDASETMAFLNTISSFITINNSTFNLETLAAGQTKTAEFNVSVSPLTPVGTIVELPYNVTSGFYGLDQSVYVKVGLIVEDWESATMTKFNWQNGGDADWALNTDSPYEGNYCVKSGSIEDSQKSFFELELDIPIDSEISFWVKVSSEPNWDLLVFYIDNSQIDSWSGEIDWTEVSIPITEGSHTIKWQYKKDNIFSYGEDCAWIDYIVLPILQTNAMSIFAGSDAEICEGMNFATSASAQNYTTSNWTTSGTGTFEDENALNTTYLPADEDYEAGLVTLTLTVSNDDESLSDDVELVFSPLPVQAGPIAGKSIVCLTSVSDYSIYNIANANSYYWELEPANAGTFSSEDTVVNVSWENDYVGQAELKVQGVNNCGNGEFSNSFQITIDDCSAINEYNENVYATILPNPNNGSFKVVINQKDVSFKRIKITDLNGLVLYEQKDNIKDEIFVNVDIENGLYLLVLENGHSRFVQKIIVQK